MLLTSLEVQGFRSLKQVKISFDQLTLLIGGNDTGKSSILDLLNIVLGDGNLDADDFHCPPGEDNPVETIEVILEFFLDLEKDEERFQYALDDILKIRKLYTLDGEETYYWDKYPEDKRLRLDDFEKGLTADEQKDLLREYDPSAESVLRNKGERAERLAEIAQDVVPQTQGWREITRRGWNNFLPRFFRYSAMGYDNPSSYIFNTLQLVFESILYEDEENRRLVSSLREVRNKAEIAINNKVRELLSYIQKYNDRVQDVSYEPTIDFARGLRQGGQFQINYGRGFRYLSKIGDGTKRRMFIATLDWDRDITLEQASQDSGLPPVIRGYDEPDTNLDYDAQRTMCRAIFSIVQEEKARTQAILCTHSPPMIDRVPAQHIRLLSLSNDCTQVEQLETGNDPEVETFLRETARELGITNTLIFYERCLVLVEGETEENALPILYRKTYGHSLLEDGIQLVNVKGNGAVKEFLRLLSRNRKELTIMLVDKDTQQTNEAELTEEALRSAGFNDEFIGKQLLYIGDREFEDAFPDEVIAKCLQEKWPKSVGEWEPTDVAPLREQDQKFSDALWTDLVCKHTKGELRSSWSKPTFAKEMARCCSKDKIPAKIRYLFELSRKVAGCD